MGLIDEAVAAGARLEKACEVLGLSARTIEWKRSPGSAAKRSRIRRSRDRQDERARRRMSEGGRAVVGA
jgi:hypothetical protein